MDILQQKPFFTAKFKTHNTCSFLVVNDVSIYRKYEDDGQVNFEMPINMWMNPNTNSIGIIMLPEEKGMPINPRCSVVAELWVKAHEGAESYKITDIHFSGATLEEANGCSRSSASGKYNSKEGFCADDEGNVEVFDIEASTTEEYEGALILTRKIKMPNALPLWGFFDSDELPDYDAIESDEEYDAAVDDLLPVYMNVQDALAAGTEEAIDAVMPLFEERNREMNQAFYLPEGSYEGMLRDRLLQSATDENYELVELNTQSVGLTPEENKKLISLTRGGCTDAVGFDLKNGAGSLSFSIMCRRKNGEWIISR